MKSVEKSQRKESSWYIIIETVESSRVTSRRSKCMGIRVRRSSLTPARPRSPRKIFFFVWVWFCSYFWYSEVNSVIRIDVVFWGYQYMCRVLVGIAQESPIIKKKARRWIKSHFTGKVLDSLGCDVIFIMCIVQTSFSVISAQLTWNLRLLECHNKLDSHFSF